MEEESYILIYQTNPKAGRVKLYIPFKLKKERELFKKLDTSFYHPNQKLWSILNSPEYIQQIKKLLRFQLGVLNELAIQALADLEQKLILKAYSTSTVKNYCSAIVPFFLFYQGRDLKELTKEEIEGFVYHQLTKYKISESAQNTLINAIKAYYEHVLGKERTVYEIQRPKKSHSLSNLLSEEEVSAIIQSIENLKHKTIIMLIYSAGLRISEALKLRICDIHSDEGYLFLREQKVKKIEKQCCLP